MTHSHSLRNVSSSFVHNCVVFGTFFVAKQILAIDKWRQQQMESLVSSAMLQHRAHIKRIAENAFDSIPLNYRHTYDCTPNCEQVEWCFPCDPPMPSAETKNFSSFRHATINAIARKCEFCFAFASFVHTTTQRHNTNLYDFSTKIMMFLAELC